MKTKIIFSLCMMFICSTLGWGQTWELSATMTAVLDNNVMTISTTLEAEAMSASAWPGDYRDQIHSLVIEDGVTSISSWAFAHHAYLTSVTMANSVTVIENYAFYNCVNLPMITIPEGVTTLEHAAFKLCGSLTEIDIPASVSSIQGEMFVDCGQLEAIHVHADNTAYFSDEGILYNKDKTTLIIYPEGKKDATFEIPGTVEKVETGAFYNSRLEAISIPNSVTGIGTGAFQACKSLTSILIPASVEEIGFGVFSFCTKLTSIEVDAENKTYASDAGILYSQDKTLLHTFPAGISSDFTVPFFVIAIGEHAFWGNSLLTSVTMPNSVTAIGEATFNDCINLTSVTLSNTLTEIPPRTFNNCSSLASIDIPNTVTSIGRDAFNSCTDITSITLPFSITEIGEFAFKACTGLTEVTVEWELPLETPDNVFDQVNTLDIRLFVPTGTALLYTNADVWMDFGSFDEYDFTSNEEIASYLAMTEVKAWTQNGILYIAGFTPGKPLFIYNLTGQLVYSGITKAGEVQIPFAWHGVYVVVSGEQSVKVSF